MQKQHVAIGLIALSPGLQLSLSKVNGIVTGRLSSQPCLVLERALSVHKIYKSD